YFTPLPGYFSPFPHGTSSLSVAKEYLALRGGPRGFRPGFPCPAVLRNFRSEAVQFRLRGRYPLWRAVPCTSPTTQLCNSPTRRQTHPPCALSLLIVKNTLVLLWSFQGARGHGPPTMRKPTTRAGLSKLNSVRRRGRR